MNHRLKLWRQNRAYVRANWRTLDSEAMRQLKLLTTKYCLSLGAGEIQLLNNHWYITHAGLLRIAQRRKCFGIRTRVMKNLSEPTTHRWVFRATVYRFPGSAGFVGYGDADPSNTSSLVRGARDARRRNAGRQPRSAQSLWNRPLLGRGVGLAAILRSASTRAKSRSVSRMATALPTASPDCGTSSAS